jgi:predicted acylesterase/phospholipase RssA
LKFLNARTRLQVWFLPGALIGALYASERTGKQIRRLVEQFIVSFEERLVDELVNRDALRWVEFLEIVLGNDGLRSSEGFISFVYDSLKRDTLFTSPEPSSIFAQWSSTAPNAYSRRPTRLRRN